MLDLIPKARSHPLARTTVNVSLSLICKDDIYASRKMSSYSGIVQGFCQQVLFGFYCAEHVQCLHPF
jgi:hypothetical protein